MAKNENKEKNAKTIVNPKLKAVKAAAARVAKTKSGLDLLRFLMDECGYKKHSVCANPETGEVITDNTVYNESRRSLWLTIRMLLPVEQRNQVEMDL